MRPALPPPGIRPQAPSANRGVTAGESSPATPGDESSFTARFGPEPGEVGGGEPAAPATRTPAPSPRPGRVLDPEPHQGDFTMLFGEHLGTTPPGDPGLGGAPGNAADSGVLPVGFTEQFAEAPGPQTDRREPADPRPNEPLQAARSTLPRGRESAPPPPPPPLVQPPPTPSPGASVPPPVARRQAKDPQVSPHKEGAFTRMFGGGPDAAPAPLPAKPVPKPQPPVAPMGRSPFEQPRPVPPSPIGGSAPLPPPRIRLDALGGSTPATPTGARQAPSVEGGNQVTPSPPPLPVAPKTPDWGRPADDPPATPWPVAPDTPGGQRPPAAGPEGASYTEVLTPARPPLRPAPAATVRPPPASAPPPPPRASLTPLIVAGVIALLLAAGVVLAFVLLR